MEMDLASLTVGVVTNDYFYAGILGALLGSAELMGRYRDDPIRIFQSLPAWVYVAVNASLALLSLYLIRELGLEIEVVGGNGASSEQANRIYNVMVAGFGGAAFFRSSVMKTKVGDTDVAIGPAIVIDTLLRVTDREIDRFRARKRAEEIARLMDNINLDQASRLVIPFCTALMQNVGAAEQARLRQAVLSLAKDTTISSKTKPMMLGLKVVEIVGFGVLQSAVTVLRERKVLEGDGDEESYISRIRRTLNTSRRREGTGSTKGSQTAQSTGTGSGSGDDADSDQAPKTPKPANEGGQEHKKSEGPAPT